MSLDARADGLEGSCVMKLSRSSGEEPCESIWGEDTMLLGLGVRRRLKEGVGNQNRREGRSLRPG